MEIEQVGPNKPNFALIVAVSSVAMLVILVVVYLLLRMDGKHLVPHHQQPHPTSQLVLPESRSTITIV